MSTRENTEIVGDNSLPEGWKWATLGDVSEKSQYGWTTKANHDAGRLKLLRTTDITSGSIDWSSVPCCTDEPEDVEKYLLESGDVLISRAGSVGVSFLINEPERAVFASYLIRFRPKKEILTKYFYYYLKSPAYWNAIGESKSGIAVPNVNASKLSQVPIPVAPLDQQKHIVAEIEKQFSRLDEAVANLKRVKANLKRYKAAVLKAAVEGRLVETEAELARREGRSYETGAQLLQRILETRRSQWKGKSKYKEPAAPDTTDLPGLPEGWSWLALHQFAALENGDRSKNYPSRSAFVEEGIPFINAGHLEGGRIDMAQMNFISDKRYSLLRAGKVREDDLLFCLRGSLGKVAIARNIARAAIASSLVIVRPVAAVIPAYLLCYFMSPLAYQQIKLYDNGSAQPNLSAADLGKFVVPVPPIADQAHIITEVDRRLSLVYEVESQIDANLARANRLRQTILGAAFSGRMQGCSESTSHLAA